ncbi:MAG: hypothetical protein KDK02_10810 [Rhodobacteraceae bacterium]|nr:hypothetical protein [Paracoccaceae bacterium]
MADRQTFIESAQADLRETQARIDKLGERADDVSKDARVSFQNCLQEARAHQDEAQRNLDKLKASGDEAWDELKSDFQSVRADLRESVEQLAGQFE